MCIMCDQSVQVLVDKCIYHRSDIYIYLYMFSSTGCGGEMCVSAEC